MLRLNPPIAVTATACGAALLGVSLGAIVATDRTLAADVAPAPALQQPLHERDVDFRTHHHGERGL
jgi:hypothetical protein